MSFKLERKKSETPARWAVQTAAVGQIPDSALQPQHYPPDELQAIVNETLDAARDAHFSK